MRCIVRLKSFRQFVHFKEINSNVYRHSLWSIQGFHYFFEWYLIIGVRAEGARGAAAPPNFGQPEEIWAKPVFKDVAMFI